MNISFADFWDGFDNNDNFFVDLLKSINPNYNFIPFSDQTEILIYSCFGRSHYQADRNKVKKIFYTGENLRPNYTECHYSLTFDFGTYSGRNIRLPLWMLQIDWFNKRGYKNPQYVIPLSHLLSNDLLEKPKQKFCSIVFNSNSPHRWEIIEKLSKYKQVDGYGKPFNNWFYGEDTKLSVLSDYKFNICFENSISSGYYTEKLIHAKTAGCLPLYWADNGCEKDFNKNSFLNLYNFNNLDEFVEKIIELDKDDMEYSQITKEYLFKNKEISLDILKKELSNIL
jgi:hypothetical protein